MNKATKQAKEKVVEVASQEEQQVLVQEVVKRGPGRPKKVMTLAAGETTPDLKDAGPKVPSGPVSARVLGLLKAGLSDAQAAVIVRSEFPNSKTTFSSVTWYRWKFFSLGMLKGRKWVSPAEAV